MSQGEVMPPQVKLEPCPFCLGETGALMRDGGTWRIWCLRPASGCGYIGPDKASQASAITHHNRAFTFAARRGFQEGVKLAAETANGVEPKLLEGMSERYVSIYCAARRDASDLIKELPSAPCQDCGGGKRTGLPGNACESCMNTGLAHPEFST